MTAARTIAPPKPWRSGWCGLGNPPVSHEHCAGGTSGLPCVCTCHQIPAGGHSSGESSRPVERVDVASVPPAGPDLDYDALVERVARRHAADAFARHGDWDDLRPAYHETARKSARRMVALVTAELRTWEA